MKKERAIVDEPDISGNVFSPVYHVRITICFILAASTIILQVGFRLTEAQMYYVQFTEQILVAVFFIVTLIRVFSSNSLFKAIRNNAIELFLAGFIILQLLLVQFGSPYVEEYQITSAFMVKLYFLTVQTYLIYILLQYLYKSGQSMIMVGQHPSLIFATSFGIIILLGTFMLLLPRSTSGTIRPNISLIDALFTASSAVCVTGLQVVDTATVFSRFGQCVIMFLIQIGGLGLMTLVGFFSLVVSHQRNLRSRLFLQDVLSTQNVYNLSSLLIIILLSTLFLEAIGASVLILGFSRYPEATENAVFHGIFHAVSAFCNAGFSTFSNNLENYPTDPLILLPVMLLLTLGGLGFPVLYESTYKLTSMLPPWNRTRKRHMYSIHTRIVLRSTLLLILLGIIAMLLSGKWHSEHSFSYIFWSSLFHGVAPRTAGFNAVPMIQFAPWGLIIIMMLMFIGAAPGGTAGGVKVTTVSLLYYSGKAMSKGRPRVEVMNRTLPEHVVRSAFLIIGFALCYLSAALVLLVWAEPELPFFDLLFELISAFGTSGLSLGITPQLSPTGKLIIILSMFVGRVGPFTVFLAIFQKQAEPLYRYPRGTVIVG
jgi:trk system potassium uptake protein TrkH